MPSYHYTERTDILRDLAEHGVDIDRLADMDDENLLGLLNTVSMLKDKFAPYWTAILPAINRGGNQ